MSRLRNGWVPSSLGWIGEVETIEEFGQLSVPLLGVHDRF